MPLFRSEEHIRRWLARLGRPGGETVHVGQLCALAHEWWRDRLDPDWRPHSRKQNQAILAAVGLAGDFWQLPPD
jgi:hypothetical protein